MSELDSLIHSSKVNINVRKTSELVLMKFVKSGPPRNGLNGLYLLVVFVYARVLYNPELIAPRFFTFFIQPKHTNTFQLVLLATERGTYAHFVFAQIDYFHFVSRYSFCRRAGTVSIVKNQIVKNQVVDITCS